MSPLNDKDLDRISREAADQFDVDQSSSGWEAVESRLNKEMPPDNRDRRRLLFFLLFLVLITGGSLAWLLQSERATIGNEGLAGKAPAGNEVPAGATGNAGENGAVKPGVADGNDPQQAADAPGVTVTDNTNKTGNTQAGTPAAGNVTKDGGDVTNQGNTTGNNVTKNGSSVTKGRNDAKKDGSNVTKNSNDVTNDRVVTKDNSGTKNNDVTKQTDVTKNKGITNNNDANKNIDASKYTDVTRYNDVTKVKKEKNTGVTKNNTDPGKDRNNKNAGLNTANNKNLSLNNNRKQYQRPAPTNPWMAPASTPLSGNDIFVTSKDLKGSNVSGDYHNPTPTVPEPAGVSMPDLSIPSQGPLHPIAIQPKKKFIQRFEIGALAGLDLSNVKFSSAGKSGVNLGLQIGYRFSNRWSVNTGVIYNKKNYKALEKDFTKKGTLRYRDMENIQGSCSMLDIPLNVRYDFGSNHKRRYFVSTGLSTYLMDKEYYDYTYYWNNEERKGSWPSSENSTYLFSILNISAGMERPLGKHFAIQAEPYLKMPLKGIGYGDLQLNSYGINLSLKYKLGGQR